MSLLVLKFGRSRPKALHWKELDRMVIKLGAFYLGNKGDHRKYNRIVGGKTHVIIFPEKKDCGQDIIQNVIGMSGVTAKEFWAVYFGVKNITKKEIEVPK